MTVAILLVLVLGFALLVAEAHLPTYGALGAAGLAAVGAGIVLAVAAAGGSVALALALTVPPAVAVAAAGALAIRKVRAGARRRTPCGPGALIGEVGIVRRPLEPLGQVLVDGEPPPSEGEAVVVDRVDGLTLSVRRAEIWEVER
jgi:membrane-bound serine protease (ClpP class)